MRAADGRLLGWTYDARQYDLVADQILLACDAIADAGGTSCCATSSPSCRTAFTITPRFPAVA